MLQQTDIKQGFVLLMVLLQCVLMLNSFMSVNSGNISALGRLYINNHASNGGS